VTRRRIREEAKIAACLSGGILGVLLAQIAHELVWRHGLTGMPGLQLLLGVPTPGGAPYMIHLFNAMVWSVWAAAGFAIVTKLTYRLVDMRRIALLYLAGAILIAAGGWLAETGIVSLAALSNTLLLIYLLAGFLLVRDWAAAPRKKMVSAGLPNGNSK
jgi:hypothetical protein